MLYHILKEAGKSCVLAGNIGIPAFDVAEEIGEDTIICFEMSSHQLEYMTVAPKYGVLMNIHEEHLDHYGTMAKYVAAKENIYRNQIEGDTLICNAQILPKEGTCKSEVISIDYEWENENADIQIGENYIRYQGEVYDIPVDEISLIGVHNYYDIGVAYAYAKRFGVSKDVFTSGLKTYETLPHRLQFIGKIDGVKYYDDSISTICDTTIQALNSLKDTDTVLIGGMDRGIDYRELIEYLGSHPVPHIILMEATGKRIYEEIQAGYPDFWKKERIELVEHLEDAVALAKKITAKDKSCVMSPAAASYGIFKNFEERGEVFARLVRN